MAFRTIVLGVLMRPGWDIYFMLLAKVASLRSTCNSRKVGAVIVRNNHVLATGYNGAVSNAPHCSDKGPDYCFRREMKIDNNDKYNYCIGSHAEVNALAQCAKLGIITNGSTLYTTLEPCNWCFKQIIQSGIKKFFYEIEYDSPNKEFDNKWRESFYKRNIIEYPQRITINKETMNVLSSFLSRNSSRRLSPTFEIDNLLQEH